MIEPWLSVAPPPPDDRLRKPEDKLPKPEDKLPRPGDKLPRPGDTSPNPGDKLPKPGDKPPKPMTMAPQRATVIVELPADAKLYVMNQPTTTTNSVRRFATPLLVPGETYFYDLRAEAIRDGKLVRQTRRLLLQPGDVVRAQFAEFPPDEPVSTANAR
jgi:uncharacterized protein (TIGR03000 family)